LVFSYRTRRARPPFTGAAFADLLCRFDEGGGMIANDRGRRDSGPDGREGGSMSGATGRQREQCWVVNNEVVDPPPRIALSPEELTARHHAFIHELDAKGILVGAGPFLDDTGHRFGTGMIIFRAATRDEAEAIANREPYIANGVRRLKLLPWQRVAGQ
jgi:uncharacterized protein YciI